MLENIMDLVKGYVKDAVNGNADIPEDKKDLTVETAISALGGGIKDNLSGLFNTESGNNTTLANLQNTISSALVSKVGLNSNVSNLIASKLVPMVINTISGKVDDSNGSGFNLDSVIKAFSAENLTEKSGLFGALSNQQGK